MKIIFISLICVLVLAGGVVALETVYNPWTGTLDYVLKQIVDYYTKTETVSNFVNRSLWTSIDNYPAACGANNYVTTIGDTLTCGIPLLIYDTTPELGGYLDTAGQNIGSTTDEIENIYVGDNTRIYFGDGQDASIYFNGTNLIISGGA